MSGEEWKWLVSMSWLTRAPRVTPVIRTKSTSQPPAPAQSLAPGVSVCAGMVVLEPTCPWLTLVCGLSGVLHLPLNLCREPASRHDCYCPSLLTPLHQVLSGEGNKNWKQGLVPSTAPHLLMRWPLAQNARSHVHPPAELLHFPLTQGRIHGSPHGCTGTLETPGPGAQPALPLKETDISLQQVQDLWRAGVAFTNDHHNGEHSLCPGGHHPPWPKWLLSTTMSTCLLRQWATCSLLLEPATDIGNVFLQWRLRS